jgi:hypothetical protein
VVDRHPGRGADRGVGRVVVPPRVVRHREDRHGGAPAVRQLAI